MNDTATRDGISWTAPLPGHWRRDFRLAEWLPGPVSRSCETWLLPALDRGFSDASGDEYGSGTKAGFVIVNGWCFTTDPMPTAPARMLMRGPVRTIRMGAAMARMGTRPELVERRIAEPGLERYRSTDLPALRHAIAAAEAQLATASPAGLVAHVDALATGTGRLMLGMVQAMGFAGKVEYAMARFFREYLEGKVACRPLDLAVGHSTPCPTPPHAVVSLDWCEPTAGERGTTTAPDPEVHARLVEARASADAACRDALTGDTKALARFDLLVGLLARWIPVREAMAAEFTLAWPTLRSLLARLGGELVERGVIGRPDHIYELARSEIDAAVAGGVVDGGRPSLDAVVDERLALRQYRRTLSPPLTIGKPVRQWKQVDAIMATLRSDPPPGTRVVVTGLGSSPGTVTGVARVVRSPDEFDTFQPGEILVAPATAPAWTPLLALAAGVVTDGGGPFAHTAVVAREFGIPAIVSATGATTTISTGTNITLDAGSGTVSVV